MPGRRARHPGRATPARAYATPVPARGDRPAACASAWSSGNLLVVSKTNRFATVHRRVKMDDITVKRVDGRTATRSRALRLARPLHAQGVHGAGQQDPDPQPQAPPDRRRRGLPRGLARLQGARRALRVVPEGRALRRPSAGGAPRALVSPARPPGAPAHPALHPPATSSERRVAVLVALPRDRFNAELRHRLQDLFLERFNGSSVDYHLSLGEEEQARIHFTVHVDGDDPRGLASPTSSRRSSRSRAPGTTGLRERLVALHGEETGNAARRASTRGASPTTTSRRRTSTSPSSTSSSSSGSRRASTFVVGLQNERGPGSEPHPRRALQDRRQGRAVRLPADPRGPRPHGRRGGADPAARRRRRDVPARLRRPRRERAAARPAECGERVADAISAVWRGEAESDSLNRLVILGRARPGARWAVLRAYRKYRSARRRRLHRVSTRTTRSRATRRIARKLSSCSSCVSTPARAAMPRPRRRLPDEILRRPRPGQVARRGPDPARALGLVERDRAHERLPSRPRGTCRSSSRSAEVPDMPKPAPLFEIFVYSPEMEGIHLRGGRVARGGIRWSDRKEDYRTEILGLMKAQMVKNAVIVPVGSKGGFVLKRAAGRQRGAEGRGRRAVLDADARPARPDRQPRRRGGRASARRAGARRRRSVPRRGRRQGHGDVLGHRERDRGRVRLLARRRLRLGRLARATTTRRSASPPAAPGSRSSATSASSGIDVQTEPFTVVGIGDMSGDVFGNGMLLYRADPPASRRSTTATCSSTRIRTRKPPSPSASACSSCRARPGTTTTARRSRPAAASGRVTRRRSRSPRRREAALGVEARTPPRPTEAHVGDPEGAGRPLLERRHRHVRQGVRRGQRRRRRPHRTTPSG